MLRFYKLMGLFIQFELTFEIVFKPLSYTASFCFARIFQSGKLDVYIIMFSFHLLMETKQQLKLTQQPFVT